jgi:hypothetical protein
MAHVLEDPRSTPIEPGPDAEEMEAAIRTDGERAAA